MMVLKIYEQMARVLGVEEIGMKILPGIIPMLISGTFTRAQFSDMMSTVRRLLDQIEKHKEKDLREMGQEAAGDGAFDMEALEKSLGIHKTQTQQSQVGAGQSVTNKDVFDFLSSLEGTSGQMAPAVSSQMPSFSFSQPSQNTQQNDIMSTLGSLATPQKQQSANSELLGGSMMKPLNPPPQAAASSGGWDSDFPIIQSSAPIQPVKNNDTNDFFSQMASQSKPVVQSSFPTMGQSQASSPFSQLGGVQFGTSSSKPVPGGNLSKMSEDPFAGLLDDKPTLNMGGGMNLAQLGQQQKPQNQGFGTFGGSQQSSQPPAFGQFGASSINGAAQNFGVQPTFNQQPLGGLNFGSSQGFGQQQNTFGGGFPPAQQSNPMNNFGTFQSQPSTAQSQPQDDFFSQFTNPQQKPQQTNGNNPFNGLF
ncbi:hypothetical protein FGO68_gene4220 [Halteria grandinella]|uniref:Uncharacterized protein n=1 Tax=Halteria grandinella TaxID=5974 RepID=A0A8J8SW24_HALGN|nr:hypothetical protein FGO68_gene4220 [Halteria grandinella]